MLFVSGKFHFVSAMYAIMGIPLFFVLSSYSNFFRCKLANKCLLSVAAARHSNFPVFKGLYLTDVLLPAHIWAKKSSRSRRSNYITAGAAEYLAAYGRVRIGSKTLVSLFLVSVLFCVSLFS